MFGSNRQKEKAPGSAGTNQCSASITDADNTAGYYCRLFHYNAAGNMGSLKQYGYKNLLNGVIIWIYHKVNIKI